jgi:ParB family chromosome partitioning protein
MSIKKQSVMDRAMLAVVGDKPQPAAGRGEGPKTAPGAFLGFMEKESAVAKENEQLRRELSSWDGAVPARPLEPNLIKASAWANRLEDSFTNAEFAALKQEIEEAGRNVQPIKVRPIPATEPQQYEVVYGHRRHRACLELGLPVWALIESLDDATMYVEMERENRDRADLSPYEQGQMYIKGTALFGGMRKLAEKIHRDISDISRATSIAKLPAVVLAAFPSKNDIQFRWAKPLSDAWSAAPTQVEQRAKSIVQQRASGLRLSAQDVFAQLIDDSGRAVEPREIVAGGSKVATLKDDKGRVTVSFQKGVLNTHQVEALVKAVKDLFPG